MAVPLPVLRDGDIAFEPADALCPPAKRAAARRVGITRGCKVLLRFRSDGGAGEPPPWPHDCAGMICGGCLVPEFWFRESIGDAKAHVAVGFATGAYADALAALGEAGAVAAARTQLADMFGPAHARALASTFEAGMFHDWAAEPFIRGAYSFPLKGCTEADWRALAAPSGDGGNGVVAWCGEHTAWPGGGMTMHVAIDTGRRAADHVHTALARSWRREVTPSRL